ncbi:hypothetical protein ONZ51_g7215 [Trametes cubensis]|uniref:F-box domain-containing protein n=1 Tax=Trametes cubensis TaxID=1111947 RepID=A0AAD7X9T1_9APHY|nr:hypothetical protein ONZ51_g7215 [Trametes cubensis]
MPHYALTCYDVLFAIFEYLENLEESWYDYDPSTQEASSWYSRQLAWQSRSTLASCSRVCRAFFRPAAALLWRNVDDVSHLIALLKSTPLLLMEPLASHSEPIDKALVKSAYLPEQASRALQYAWRVRAIHGHRRRSFSHGKYWELPDWTQGQPLFPQLRYLRWTMDFAGGDKLLELLSPSLRSLHLIFPKPFASSTSPSDAAGEPQEAFVRNLVRQIALKAPALRYMRISSGGARESWFQSVGEFAQLETFEFHRSACEEATALPLMQPLAALRHLQHLQLRLPGNSPHLAPHAFPSLQTLTLDATFSPLHAVPAFLSSVSSCNLRSLSLLNCQCVSLSPSTELHEVAEVMRSKFSSSLRQFTLELHGVSHDHVESQPLTKALGPLFSMPHLSDVHIRMFPGVVAINPSKDDLKEMAHAWPNATRLELSYLRHPSPLRDLVDVSRRCTSLMELVLPGINASAEEMKAVLSMPDPVAAPNLRSLNLFDDGSCSVIPDPERLAKCLDRLFPSADWRTPRGGEEAWAETVQELVRLRIARLYGGGSM